MIPAFARSESVGQNCMARTATPTDKQINVLFPGGKQMQCRDSKLVYSYFRLTADNPLLLGAAASLSASLEVLFRME
jgi:gamma-glutamylputrescine oxidase